MSGYNWWLIRTITVYKYLTALIDRVVNKVPSTVANKVSFHYRRPEGWVDDINALGDLVARKERSDVVADSVNTYPGNKVIKFWSSMSFTSKTRYSNWPGNRGLTENDSAASRMHTLWEWLAHDGSTIGTMHNNELCHKKNRVSDRRSFLMGLYKIDRYKVERCKTSGSEESRGWCRWLIRIGRMDIYAYTWVTPSCFRRSRFLETRKGPKRRPGMISWQSLRISYLCF
jgi:hypothetical protein